VGAFWGGWQAAKEIFGIDTVLRKIGDARIFLRLRGYLGSKGGAFFRARCLNYALQQGPRNFKSGD